MVLPIYLNILNICNVDKFKGIVLNLIQYLLHVLLSFACLLALLHYYMLGVFCIPNVCQLKKQTYTPKLYVVFLSLLIVYIPVLDKHR